MVLSIALQVRHEECQMPLSFTRVLGNRFLPESCDDVHTHFKRNWYELAGQPASQFRQPVEMVTVAFVANGARTAVSSANWNLRCSMRGQGFRAPFFAINPCQARARRPGGVPRE